MKKILFVINSLEDGGAERVLVDLANELAEYYDVTVQAVSNSGPFRARLSDKVHYKSMITTNISLFKRIFAYLINYIYPPILTHNSYIGNRYDYEIAFLEGVPTKLVAASPNTKAKKYAWVHIDLVNSYGLSKVFPTMDEHIECYKAFDKILCVSQSVKDAFIEKFGISKNVDVVYNVIDDEAVRELARSESIQKGERVRIVTVGKLSKRKGFSRLLWVMRMLKNEGIDCELQILGEGNRREELEGYIRYNDLEDRVSLLGFKDNPYPYMEAADFLVFPSMAEGYSTVATESVILGKPVIATDCAGMREIFGDSEYGVVIENDDNVLYEEIKKMVTDAKYRDEYRQKATERAKDITKESRLEAMRSLFRD